MLGNPPIVFLDEPSTGMDPEARRFMWDVISRISTLRKQSSIILTTHSMEEAEALATKMGIMVNGELKCMGSIQHIKNKFGKGYEVELKVNLPTKEETIEYLKSFDVDSNQRMTLEECQGFLNDNGNGDLVKELSSEGSGSSLYFQFTKGSVSVQMIAEYVLIERKGWNVVGFFKSEFSGYHLIEHFQNFYRFKLEANVSVGKIFGMFEENKERLGILQYSIKQSTIEQIFNMFAQNQIEVDKRDSVDGGQMSSAKQIGLPSTERVMATEKANEIESPSNLKVD